MRVIGSIIKTDKFPTTDREIYSGLLNYYDGWHTDDPEFENRNPVLARAASVFGHDLVNLATYTAEILKWLTPERIVKARSVVSVSAMTEAFFVSARSAADAIAAALASQACDKPRQAPARSLNDLVNWSKKNPSRVRPVILKVLSTDLQWFLQLRDFRDEIIHNRAEPIIFRNKRQFWLILMPPGSVPTRKTPLLPLLASQLRELLAFADLAAAAINEITDFPKERVPSRVVSGILIPSLHRLMRIADQYAEEISRK